MVRRSVSSLVSPGPRVPMPPPKRDIACPRPVKRGKAYSNWASSTCNFPARVWARWAKISKITWVRSTTLNPMRRSKLRPWAGDRSRSKTIKLAPKVWADRATSSTLPSPITVWGWGRSRRCRNTSNTSPPADSTRRSTSASPCSKARSRQSFVSKPTIMTRSWLKSTA